MIIFKGRHAPGIMPRIMPRIAPKAFPGGRP
jgi:hypothetical protein